MGHRANVLINNMLLQVSDPRSRCDPFPGTTARKSQPTASFVRKQRPSLHPYLRFNGTEDDNVSETHCSEIPEMDLDATS